MREATDRRTVAIIGAGISGLCAAYWLKNQGVNVLVLEKDSAVGGTMKTLHEDGWLIETGPNSALETTPLFQQLFDAVGIADKRIYANEAAAKRYIVRDGKLHPMPMEPVSLFTSSLLTWRGKLQLFKEPFVGRSYREESIADFVRRRLGNEFLDYAVNPFVAGISAGKPERLSVQAAFPTLYALEQEYGSLVKGMIFGRSRRRQHRVKGKQRAKLFSFLDGMQTFPNALAAKLGDSIKLSCTVERIIPMRAGQYPVYTLSYTQNNLRTTIEAAAGVLATPAYAMANIIRPIDPEMARTLESIYYPPVAEVFMGFKQGQIKRTLDGFGFLVPEKEERKILGTIWSSVLFPNRAPENSVALTTFVGGARQPEIAMERDEQLSNIVLDELQSLMGIAGEPLYTKIIRWERAIPQYDLGYQKILKAMERFEENFRGAFLCSNYRGGISVGDCVMSAEKTVQRVHNHLEISAERK